MIIGTIIAANANVPLGYFKSRMNVPEYTGILEEGSSIPDNRNKVFEAARIMNDDLLFIDSDMVFTPQDVKRMEENLKKMDIVSGVCVMSYEGHPASIFDDNLKLKKPSEAVEEIGGCGAAFLGISRRVLQTLHEPFTPLKYEKTGQYYGEDISFCIRARQEGFKIFCDGTLHIGHIKSKTLYYNG